MARIPLLSFFSGGGFLDLGFEIAGFDIVWSNEVQESYADMYRAGISSWRRSNGDSHVQSIPWVNQQSVEQLTKSVILKEAFGSTPPDVYGMIGGPPCQDFSAAGKDLGHEGDRGRWTQTFIDLIGQLRPTFFLMENVPGLNRRKHKEYFNTIVKQLALGDSGYLTSAKILSALELGVPQDRDRLFLVGFRKDVVAQQFAFVSLIGQGSNWFPWPEPVYGNAKNLNWPKTTPFGAEDVPVPVGIPLELTVNRLVQDEAELLPNGQEAFNPYSEKFKVIAEGDVSGKSFKRLHRYRYSPTAWYGNNEVHLHPWKPRRLTVREALRIQTVPDEYVLPPETTLTDKFRIISNGVPTLMAKLIAKSLLEFIKEQEIESVANETTETTA